MMNHDILGLNGLRQHHVAVGRSHAGRLRRTAHIRTDQPPTVPQNLKPCVGSCWSHHVPSWPILQSLSNGISAVPCLGLCKIKGYLPKYICCLQAERQGQLSPIFCEVLLFFDNTLEAVIAHGFANQPNSRVTQRQQRVVRSFARNASAPRYPRIGSGLCQTKEDKLFDQKQL